MSKRIAERKICVAGRKRSPFTRIIFNMKYKYIWVVLYTVSDSFVYTELCTLYIEYYASNTRFDESFARFRIHSRILFALPHARTHTHARILVQRRSRITHRQTRRSVRGAHALVNPILDPWIDLAHRFLVLLLVSNIVWRLYNARITHSIPFRIRRLPKVTLLPRSTSQMEIDSFIFVRSI